MRVAIDNLHGKLFKGRDLRVKKAVEPKRLEKKKLRKEERAQAAKEGKTLAKEQKDEDMEIMNLRNFEKAAYGAGDDHERAEEAKTERKNKAEAMADHFAKIQKKGIAALDGNTELDITNRLGHKKADRQKINKQKIESVQADKGFKSKFENSKNAAAFKE